MYAEVERHAYFQLSVTYRTESYYPSYAMLLIRWTFRLQGEHSTETFRLQGEHSTDWANRPV